VVDLIFTESVTVNDINALCSEWNSYTLGEQERFAEEFATQAQDPGNLEGLEMFEFPDRAAEGVVAAFLTSLEERCS